MTLKESLSAVGLNNVSRETCRRLTVYSDCLRKWNKKINLVSQNTLPDLESRHIADCAQFHIAAPKAQTWVDLGSGAGLPGLIVAALRSEQDPDFSMTLIDSDIRKSAFQREVARLMGLKVTIETRRIESEPDQLFDIVSARALAPLPKLIALARPYMKPSGHALFAKGESTEEELTEAASHWKITSTLTPSRTRPGAALIHVRGRPDVRNDGTT